MTALRTWAAIKAATDTGTSVTLKRTVDGVEATHEIYKAYQSEDKWYVDMAAQGGGIAVGVAIETIGYTASAVGAFKTWVGLSPTLTPVGSGYAAVGVWGVGATTTNIVAHNGSSAAENGIRQFMRDNIEESQTEELVFAGIVLPQATQTEIESAIAQTRQAAQEEGILQLYGVEIAAQNTAGDATAIVTEKPGATPTVTVTDTSGQPAEDTAEHFVDQFSNAGVDMSSSSIEVVDDLTALTRNFFTGDTGTASSNLSIFGGTSGNAWDSVNIFGGNAWELPSSPYMLVEDTPISFGASPYLSNELFVSLDQPDWITQTNSFFEWSASLKSPLVLDLDGDSTAGGNYDTYDATSGNAVRFDIDNDGFAERIGWISADDAHLAKDRNGNGKIDDVTELYGDDEMLPFAKLALEDTNNDGVIDNQDTTWNDLRAWQDLNEDGITDAGELKTLDAVGVKSISLNYSAVGTDTNNDKLGEDILPNGNLIASEATFTRTDNTTSKIYDIRYQNIDTDSVYLGSGNADTAAIKIDPETLFLPQLRGYGELPALSIAMSQDATLKQLVKDFVNLDVADFDQVSDLVQGILFQWAGTTDTNPAGRQTFQGNFIDARKVGFADALLGSPFMQRGQDGYIGIEAAEQLRYGWDVIESAITERLLIQGPLKEFFPDATLDYLADEMSLNDTYTDVKAAVDAFVLDNTPDLDFWVALGEILVAHATDLGTDTTTIETDLTTWSGTSIDFDDDGHLQMGGGGGFYGTASPDVIDIEGGGVVYAGAGDDLIYIDAKEGAQGEDGDDFFIAGDGKSSLSGGNGNDIFNSGNGADWLTGGNGDDHFKTGTGGFLNQEYIGVPGSLNGTPGIQAPHINMEFDHVHGNNGTDTYYALSIPLDQDGNLATITNVRIFNPDGSYSHTGNVNLGAYVNLDENGIQVVRGYYEGMIIRTADTAITNHASAHLHYELEFSTVEYGRIYSIENISGSHRSDWLGGDANANAINGERGDDILQGQGGDDVLFGEDGQDFLYGGTGSDILFSSAGNDYFNGDAANGENNGGDIDTLVLAHSEMVEGVFFDKQANTGGGGADANQVSWGAHPGNVFNVEAYVTSQHDDFFAGDNTVENIDAGAGNDTVFGFGGNDVLVGGDGFDILNGGAGDDHLYGAFATDAEFAGLWTPTQNDDLRSDLLRGDIGNDYLRGGLGQDTYLFLAGDGHDTIQLETADTLIFPVDYTADFGDLIVFDASVSASSVSFAQTNNDLVISYATSDTITVNDWFDNTISHEPFKEIRFESGDPEITYADIMAPFNDAAIANADTAVVDEDGSISIDVIANDTDADSDPIYVSEITTVPLNGTAVINTDGTIQYTPNEGFSGTDTFTYHAQDIFTFGGDATVTITVRNVINGDDTANTLDGTAEIDVINGFDGNDDLEGFAGADLLSGGDGDDTLFFDADDLANGLVDGGTGHDIGHHTGGLNEAVTINFADTNLEFIRTQQGNDTFIATTATAGVEGWGYGGDDTFEGSTFDDTFHGGTGIDLLNGGDGNDTLHGDLNVDTINGGDGDDTIYGGDGHDIINGGEGNDTISGGADGDIIRGGAGDDVIYADGGEDTIYGDAGADRLYGSDDADDIIYDADDIVIQGNGGYDEAMAEGSVGIDYDFSNSSIEDVTGSIADDVLSNKFSSDAIIFRGSTGNDHLKGGSGDDNLRGEDDDDTLEGFAGADLLYGGSGNDILVGGLGIDSLFGDGGDDTLKWDSEDSFNGGTGHDTLSLADVTSGQSITFGSGLWSIEQVDLDNSQADTISVSESNVGLRAENDTLYINGDASDDVTTGSEFATRGTNLVHGGITFATFTENAATLHVEIGMKMNGVAVV